MKKVLEELAQIRKAIGETNKLLIMLIKRVSANNSPPMPWLDVRDKERAKELREKNSELYDYVVDMFKLFFT